MTSQTTTASLYDYDEAIEVSRDSGGAYSFYSSAEPERASSVAAFFAQIEGMGHEDCGPLIGWGDWARVFRAFDEEGRERWYFAR